MLRSRIKRTYEVHNCQRICQGDILRDVDFCITKHDGNTIQVRLPYIIVVSQDCDLAQGSVPIIPAQKTDSSGEATNNQYVPNILFLPAFVADSLRDGDHLKGLYGIKQGRLVSEQWRPITKNNNDRYHYLKGVREMQVPNLIVDFKIYYTLPQDYFLSFYSRAYLATLNELFREQLSQRFAFYLNRIGVPDLNGRKVSSADSSS
jgi:hypothetical protein